MIIQDNIPLSTLAPLSKKSYEEVLTAHNISILLLIQSYITERDNEVYSIERRVGFCKLIQFLLQSPDFSFSQFMAVISDSKYNVGSKILNRFQTSVVDVVNSDVDLLLTCITDSSRYLLTDPPPAVSIHRLCPIGVFLRKMIVFLDKLTFPQTVKVYRLYQQYYIMGKDCLQIDTKLQRGRRRRIIEDVKNPTTIEQPSSSTSSMMESCDFNSIEVSVFTQNPFTNPIVSLFDVSAPTDDEKLVECLSWSHRQTELFLAEQAIFLEFDESSALPPRELHQILNRIILINPDYPETYFVSYLNCLRVKEFNGALENLIQFFDSVNYSDKSKSYRYAALNLAIFNVKFNNRAGAITALKECIMLSHESKDNICLYFAQAWLRCLNEDKKLDLIESSTCKCDELELHQIASLSLQMCAQKYLIAGEDGNIIFNLLDKSDAVNSQRILPDLTLTNLAHRAAVWCTYGQFNITFLMSQILLNIDTSYAVYGLKTYNTQDVCICICNVANFLTSVGKYQVAKTLLSHAKDRFPHQFSERWKMCELILYFEYSLRSCLWNDAYKSARRIAAIDKRESLLRLAELSYEKGDKVEAASFIDSALSLICSRNNKYINYNPHYLLRAYLIGAKVKSGGASFFMLQKALTYAIRCGYPRFRALIQLELAELQLELGRVKQATDLIEKSSVVIFSENRYDEQAAALVLLAKCNITSVSNLDASNDEKICKVKNAISMLEIAKTLYQKLECTSKVKDVVFLQVNTANEIDLYEARNTYAVEFRKIDFEQNHSYSCASEFHCSM